MNIVLIGFMGAGKSTVGRHLGMLLDRPWIDTDELVYKKTNTKNMQEVFSIGGESLLRSTEMAIAQEYATTENIIISTGGGIVLNKEALDYFTKTGGIVVFLNAKFDTITARLAADSSRPLFNEQANAKALYDFRWPLYAEYADKSIDVDAFTVQEIAMKIKEMIVNGF